MLMQLQVLDANQSCEILAEQAELHKRLVFGPHTPEKLTAYALAIEFLPF